MIRAEYEERIEDWERWDDLARAHGRSKRSRTGGRWTARSPPREKITEEDLMGG